MDEHERGRICLIASVITMGEVGLGSSVATGISVGDDSPQSQQKLATSVGIGIAVGDDGPSAAACSITAVSLGILIQ